jgi:hypothetical protein
MQRENSLPVFGSAPNQTCFTHMPPQPSIIACPAAVPLELPQLRYPTPCGGACPAPAKIALRRVPPGCKPRRQAGAARVPGVHRGPVGRLKSTLNCLSASQLLDERFYLGPRRGRTHAIASFSSDQWHPRVERRERRSTSITQIAHAHETPTPLSQSGHKKPLDPQRPKKMDPGWLLQPRTFAPQARVMAAGVRNDVCHEYTCFIWRGEDARLHGR